MIETGSAPLLDTLRQEIAAAVAGVDPVLLALGAAVLVILVAILAFGRRRVVETNTQALATAELAEIKGRLTVLSEMTVKREAEQTRTFDDRMEQVAQRLSGSIESVSRRLSESLSETQRQNGDTVARLGERVDTLARHMAQSLDSAS